MGRWVVYSEAGAAFAGGGSDAADSDTMDGGREVARRNATIEVTDTSLST